VVDRPVLEPSEAATADAFTRALRLFRVAVESADFAVANERVEGLLDQLDAGQLRGVAEALALLPRFAGRPLSDRSELDRLEALFAWVFS
jgi:hypothetical protein